MVSSSDGTRDGGLLLVVGKALSSEVSGSTLRNLDNDWGLDISNAAPNRSFSRVLRLYGES